MIVFVFVIILLIFCMKQMKRTKLFPPGLPRLPIVGSIPFLAKYPTAFLRLQDLSDKYGDIFGFYVAHTPVVVLSRFDLLKQVFSLETTTGKPFSYPGWLNRNGDSQTGDNTMGLVFSQGTLWQEQRRFALRNLKDFGFGRKSMEEVLLAEAHHLCNALKLDLDCPTKLDYKLNLHILKALWRITVGEELNTENKDYELIFNKLAMNIRTGIKPKTLIMDVFPSLRSCLKNYFFKEILAYGKQIKGIIRQKIEEHLQDHDPENHRDFLDVYIEAHKNTSSGSSSFHGERGLVNLESVLLDIFEAGSETTSSTITWGVLYLLHHPEVQEKIHEELDVILGDSRIPSLQDEASLPYLCATIHEILRSSSIAYAVAHKADADVLVDGCIIPKGSTIIGNLIKIMHNPQVFQEPELFNPGRFIDGDGQFQPHPHVVPFSVGKRVCLGLKLAEMELFLFLSSLLQTFRFLPVPNEKLPSYSIRSRIGTTNAVVRFCPSYNLIIQLRKSDTEKIPCSQDESC